MLQMGEPQVDMEIDDACAAETHEGEQSAPRQASVQSTPTDFSLLQGQLDSLAREMRDTRIDMRDTRAEILARQSAMTPSTTSGCCAMSAIGHLSFFLLI
jgi:hypothetical protein